jgi:hypothetical protein
LADFENWSLWQPDFREGGQTSQDPMNVGTTFLQALDIQGKRIELLCKVTQYEPNEKLSFACEWKNMSFAVDFVCEPVDGGTRLTSKGEGRVDGFYSLFEPLVEHKVNEKMKANLENLKGLLES